MLCFAGYTDVVKGLVRMGLLSPDQNPALHPQVHWLISQYIYYDSKLLAPIVCFAELVSEMFGQSNMHHVNTPHT